MKNVIITGPTGAVGMALLEYLTGMGINVTAVCRRGSNRKERLLNRAGVTVVECNLDELDKLAAMVNKKQDAFFHFAWEGTFGDSRNDCELQNRNVAYTLKAVLAAKECGCSVFVGAGSQAEYGRFEGALSAKTPTFPENGYGIGKLCAGQMSRLLCSQLNIRHIWARILSVYGPYDGAYTMVMGTIGKLLKGEVPKLTLGEQQWDYLYSRDAARALFLMAQHGSDGKVYCLGSGQARPLKEYIEILRDTAAPKAELGFGEVPYGKTQVFHLEADITDLQKDTGFSPSIPFEKGIAETIAWYKENYCEKN